MAGPLDALPKIDVGVAGADQPVPAPDGFFANFGQAFSNERLVARSDRFDAEYLRLHREYAPIVDALGLNRDQNPAGFSPISLYAGMSPTHSDLLPDKGPAMREMQEALIASEIARRQSADPNFLKDVPSTVDGLHRWFLQREKARQQGAAQQVAATQGLGGDLGALAGGIFENAIDLPNIITAPIGGFGRTAAVRILTDGLTMAGISAGEQPTVAHNRQQMGEDYTAGDFFTNVGGAAAGGAFLRGLGEGGAALGRAGGEAIRARFPDWARARDADAFGKALNRATTMGGFDESQYPQVATRLMDPELGIRSDVEARRQINRELAAGTIDDRAVAAHFRLAVPEDLRTPDERAALAGIDSDASIAEASPYKPGIAGDRAHRAQFVDALRHVLDETAPARPPEPAAAAPQAGGPGISQDGIIRFVINDLEGGARVVHYSDADGGTTKYGIAQRDHPGVDVASLTEDQAADIARRRYWFPELDQAPPAVAAVGFDAGFIGGPDVGRRIVAESGGDVSQALRLYREHLNHIADTVPGKAKFRKGWNARVDRLAERLQATEAPFGPPELRPELEPEVAAGEGATPPGEAAAAEPEVAAPPREFGIPEEASEPIATLVDATEGGQRARRGAARYYEPLVSHPDYQAAKAGDLAAADRVVHDLVTPDNLAAASDLKGAIFVPVVAEERGGRNAIPHALAGLYADAVGGRVETDILQTVRAHHTGAGAVDRLARRAAFRGPVEPGAHYVLVDDVGTMGGTIAELADHIQRGGGVVKRVVLLANGAGRLAPDPAHLRAIEESGIGDVIRQSFGIEPGTLTGAEARWLSRRRSVERVRSHVAKGLVEERGGRAGGLAGGEESQGQLGRGSSGLSEFDEPHGSGEQAQVASLEHDLRMEMSGAAGEGADRAELVHAIEAYRAAAEKNPPTHYQPAHATYRLADLVGAPRLVDWIADKLGTREWVVAPRLSKRLKEEGYELAISQKHYTAQQRAWEDDVLRRAAAGETAAPEAPAGPAVDSRGQMRLLEDRQGYGPGADHAFLLDEHGGEISLGEIFDDLDREQAGADALRACMKPGGAQ